ncbi:uncharacterized protein LOC120265782 isoform X2 [Dioscorea cayenensis subsp. rotundata]|uniref:Uncharacterized protein LOC120265782 isoform X2 n=1 Tax=Dioscorea cayennensis subsp. rotundata TaxID=55577 RepID=A0AB40BQI9_DIOCR|nr:uncharacterized protein LOC120265782 isoform X2 [Dioscorea cayenensis subsp. rotundata]
MGRFFYTLDRRLLHHALKSPPPPYHRHLSEALRPLNPAAKYHAGALTLEHPRMPTSEKWRRRQRSTRGSMTSPSPGMMTPTSIIGRWRSSIPRGTMEGCLKLAPSPPYFPSTKAWASPSSSFNDKYSRWYSDGCNHQLSGGPLLDPEGNLIGINTTIFTRTEAY